MKKTGFILLCSFLIGGCMLPWKNGENTILGKNDFVTESSIPYEEEEAKFRIQEDKSEQDKMKDENSESLTEDSEAFTDEKKADLMRKQQELYYFSNLEITQQNLYVEILYALENYIDEMEVSTLDTDQIDKVFHYVMMDHPEIFYINGYSFVKYSRGRDVEKIVFKGTYIYNQQEKELKEKQIEEAVEIILENIALDATDYEKVKYVYDTIIYNTEYDLNAVDNQNICSVFLNHSSVCQGYAKAFQYLLNILKVPTMLVTGTVETGEGHAWNLVKVNNEYYYVDATWGDASYQLQNNEEMQMIQNAPAISYDYLCVTTEDLIRTHTLSEMVPMPECKCLDANYYVKEGAYFKEADYEQLANLMERYMTEGRESVTIRCADDSVYQQMCNELLVEQKIFQYMNGKDNSIMYMDSPKQFSITFWL